MSIASVFLLCHHVEFSRIVKASCPWLAVTVWNPSFLICRTSTFWLIKLSSTINSVVLDGHGDTSDGMLALLVTMGVIVASLSPFVAGNISAVSSA